MNHPTDVTGINKLSNELADNQLQFLLKFRINCKSIAITNIAGIIS
jgi:hypothetical protein